MTNFKFQNVARETILFETTVNGENNWREQLKDIVLLTREAYSMNLAPVGLGDKVAILLTYEDPTLSTVRLCFRVIDQRGQPISCGYQTMIAMHKDTHELLSAPPMVLKYADARAEWNLLEGLRDPSFGERTMAGSREIKRIFPESIRRLGETIANAPVNRAYPRIINESFNEYTL